MAQLNSKFLSVILWLPDLIRVCPSACVTAGPVGYSLGYSELQELFILFCRTEAE
jgi:hypothetical protein